MTLTTRTTNVSSNRIISNQYLYLKGGIRRQGQHVNVVTGLLQTHSRFSTRYAYQGCYAVHGLGCWSRKPKSIVQMQKYLLLLMINLSNKSILSLSQLVSWILTNPIKILTMLVVSETLKRNTPKCLLWELLTSQTILSKMVWNSTLQSSQKNLRATHLGTFITQSSIDSKKRKAATVLINISWNWCS